MASTVEQIYNWAIQLMDEADPDTGAAQRAENRDYFQRTPAILTVLQAECYPFAQQWRAGEPGIRPVCPPLTGPQDTLSVDDGLCQGVLPYGLAAHLLLDEHPEMASYFAQRYEELLQTLGRALPLAFRAIEPPYGGVERGEFARWG